MDTQEEVKAIRHELVEGKNYNSPSPERVNLLQMTKEQRADRKKELILREKEEEEKKR